MRVRSYAKCTRRYGVSNERNCNPNCNLGCLVSQALSPRELGEDLRAAEDRGFEPRRAVKPNRISSAAP
jgi:hypothetical protein